MPNKEPTASDVHTAPVLKEVPVAKDASLITVRTIKAKFVEQMPKWTAIPEPLTAVGTTSMGAFVVAQRGNGHLVKVHFTDWIQYLTADLPVGTDWNVAREAASKTIDSYPQLFQD